MVKIELLKNHAESIPMLASIWHEVLGKIWVPDVPIERVIDNLGNHLNEDVLPLTFVAFEQDKPVRRRNHPCQMPQFVCRGRLQSD